jgi:photosystem II stability/assembly factor-like uncharacterized protein
MFQARRLKKSLLIVLVMGLLLGVVLSVQAQEVGFNEPFDDPALPGWDHNPNAVGIDGVLRLEGGGFAFHPGEWINFELSLRVRRTGSEEIIVLFQSSEGQSYILVIGVDFVLLQREAAGNLVELASAYAVEIPQESWFGLQAHALDGGFLLLLNDQLILEAADQNPLPPGGIGFEVLGGTIGEFDDLELRLLGDQEPGQESEPQQPESQTPEGEPAASGDLAWVRTGGPLGGLGYDVRMRPDNPDKMYVTDAFAGVFISDDGGQNWYASNQGISAAGGMSGDAIPIFCLTIDPTNYDIIWTGTQGVRGIFRSEDGGKTWQKRDNGVIEDEGITFRGFTVDTNDNNIVYAAAEITGWTWAGKDMVGREFDRVKGVVYKTTNGGQNWSAVWRGDNLARYIWIDPRDSDVLYISTGIFDREAADSDPIAGTPGGEGVLKSTDGGQTWQNINNGLKNLYVGTLFMHPENPDILLAGTGNNQYHEQSGVYFTSDGGMTWQQTLVGRGGISVEFSSLDPNIAYAGDTDGIFRSIDGGWTWEQMDSEEQGWGTLGVLAGFPIDFQVDPRDPNRIFANNYGGGNFLSEDGGATWTVASTGYTGAQVRAIAVDPNDPARVYVAARSGIFVSQDGGNNWQGLSFPPARVLEWNAVAIDPNNSRNILAANNWLMGSILRSMDGGISWGLPVPEGEMGYAWRSLAYAPSNSKIIYAGAGAFSSAGSFNDELEGIGINLSTDGGVSWNSANDGNSEKAQVAGLAVSPIDAQVVFAATVNKGLLLSRDSGQNWTRLSQGLPGNYSAFSVAVSPDQPDWVYVGLNRQGLYRSTDGGTSWVQASPGLNPESQISSIIFDPTNAQVIYAADRSGGVFRSTDSGQRWQAINQGLLTRAVNALSISSDGLHLYAATEGGGVFRLDLNGQPPVSSGTPLIFEDLTEDEGERAEQPEVESPAEADQSEDERPPEEEVEQPPEMEPVAGGQAEPEPEPDEEGSGLLIGGIAVLLLIILGSIIGTVVRKNR